MSGRSSRPTTPGLPSGPRVHSSAHRSRPDEHHSREPYHPSSFRHTSSRGSPRRPSRPTDDTERAPRQDERRRPSASSHRSANSTSSANTVSSNASSLFDRARVASGYASSRTSFEDDDPPTQSKSLRSRRLENSDPSLAYEANNDSSYDGDGATIWSKVAGAASTLTVSVSKAWATNVPLLAGEETPEGGETRLTKALKAYHLAKAQHPSDLPDWLFEPHERKPVVRQTAPDSPRKMYRDVQDVEATVPPRSSGLRDIYAAAAATGPAAPSTVRARLRYPESQSTATPSKASDRLRAIRDAKRGVLARDTALEVDSRRDDNVNSDIGMDRSSNHTPSGRIAPRPGLPSGPGGMRRMRA